MSNENYVPYGEEWVKEMNKMPKAMILKIASQALQEKNTRVDELEKALRTLVNLKHYKDDRGKDDYYKNNQPLAWVKAEILLKK